MIKLRLADDSRRQWLEMIARIEALAQPTAEQVEPIQQVIRAGFAFNFAREMGDDAPWAALTPFTVRERRRLGYPGEHPILFRSGSYHDSFVDEGHARHISEWDASGGLWTVAEGSSDPRAEELEFGRWDMAGRPVTLLGESGEQRIETVLDEMFGGWFEEE